MSCEWVLCKLLSNKRHQIDLLHKSHNAPFPYSRTHRFVTETCICAHISVTKWCIVGYFVMHCGIREVNLFKPTFYTAVLYNVVSKFITLLWRHNERNGASNHRRIDSLLSRLFRRRSKKTPTLRVTGLCKGNSPVTGEFPAQRASNAEKVSFWWRHHVIITTVNDISNSS